METGPESEVAEEPLSHSADPERGRPAKAYADHVSEVTGSVEVRLDQIAPWLDPELMAELRSFLPVAGEFHDLGKLEALNQEKLRSPGSRGHLPVPHDEAGTLFLERKRNAPASAMVAAHHKGLIDQAQFIDKKTFRPLHHGGNTHGDAAEKCALIEKNLEGYLEQHVRVRREVPPEVTPLPSLPEEPLLWRLALGILADADYTSAGHDTLRPDPELKAGERLAALEAYVSELSTSSPQTADSERMGLRQDFFRACRNEVHEEPILICEGAVGIGKTTAVMAHLLARAVREGLRRIFVVLPYTNIIDQAVEVYRDALVLPGEEPEEIVAACHHRVDLSSRRFRELSTLWRAPIVVTTAVGFFETLACNRPSAVRRLVSLPGSGFFLDEFHAAMPTGCYPAACRWIGVLAERMGCRFVLASGSLARIWESKRLVRTFDDEPKSFHRMASWESIGKLAGKEVAQSIEAEKRRVAVKTVLSEQGSGALTMDDLLERVLQEPGPRIVVFNTTRNAAKFAKMAAARIGEAGVEHLSTVLSAEDRSATVQRVSKRLKDPSDRDWLLSATSCVEAGMNFSFRRGFRERASLASLLQLLGRIAREGEYDDAQVLDFALVGENSNPGLKYSARAIETMYFKAGNDVFSSTYVTQSVDEELRLAAQKFPGVKTFRMDIQKQFATFAKEFRIVQDEGAVLAIHVKDPLLRELADFDASAAFPEKQAMRKKIQERTFRVPLNTKTRSLLEPFAGEGDDGLHVWKGDYDSRYGYWAGLDLV